MAHIFSGLSWGRMVTCLSASSPSVRSKAPHAGCPRKFSRFQRSQAHLNLGMFVASQLAHSWQCFHTFMAFSNILLMQNQTLSRGSAKSRRTERDSVGSWRSNSQPHSRPLHGKGQGLWLDYESLLLKGFLIGWHRPLHRLPVAGVSTCPRSPQVGDSTPNS